MTNRVSALTSGTNSFQTTAEDVNAFATDFASDGVVGSIVLTSGSTAGSGPLAIIAQASPNMTVQINGGTAWITVTPAGQASQRVRVQINANTSYTIANNSTGSTVYDYIYVKVDPTLANNPDVNAATVGSFVTSRSTSNTTDNGSGKPTYGYCLGYITVVNNATSISNGGITDKRGTIQGPSVNVFGPGSPVVGSGTTGGWLIQGGTIVVTTSTGQGSLSFPKSFPNGVLTIVATPGDGTAGGATGPYFNASSYTKSGATFSTGNTFSGAYRLNWIAIGW